MFNTSNLPQNQNILAGISLQEHSGPFAMGDYVQLKNFNVQIESFLAEGGFAHVYSCIFLGKRAVLKRVSCPDNISLKYLLMEAETQKLLSGHENIVSFLDYSYSQLKTGGFELLLLMEHCAGKLCLKRWPFSGLSKFTAQ
jgi:AP2-associated kinase